MERATLILTRRDIAGAMPLGDHVAAVETAFSRYCEGTMHVPPVIHLPGVHGGFHVKSAGFSGPPSYVAVKINSNFPSNPARCGRPTIQGAIVLFDTEDGAPLAILDSAEITALRTAATTAVAARLLADPGAETATVIGCGVQGRLQLEALCLVLPIAEVCVHDVRVERAAAFAEEMGRATGVKIGPVASFPEGTSRSEVVVTCTPSTQPFLRPAHVRPGAFIAAVGADHPGKNELAPELMKMSRVIVDIVQQAAEMGDLRHAIAAGVMTRGEVHAELGEVIRGLKAGRESPEEVIVFDSTGSAIQDVAVAGRVNERALEKGLGLPVVLA